MIALIPRDYSEDHTGANPFRLIMWPRATSDSSKATTSAGRPFGRTILQNKDGAPVAADTRFGAIVKVEFATHLRVRTN